MIVGENILMNFEEVILSFQKAKKVSQSVLDNLVWMNESNIGISIGIVNVLIFLQILKEWSHNQSESLTLNKLLKLWYHFMTFGKKTFVDFQRSLNSFEKAKILSQSVLDKLVWMN